MSNISTWSTTAASNNAATPDGFPEGQSPSSLNDCGRTLMAAIRTQHESAQWIDYGHTPTKVDSDTFTVSGDQTSIYDAGRRIKFTGSVSGYATISSSSYSAPNTTVNVSAASWTGTLTAVAVGILSGSNGADPNPRVVKIKTSDTDKTSTTTLADDSVLIVALDATACYEVDLWIVYNLQTSSTQGLKIRLNYTGTNVSSSLMGLGLAVATVAATSVLFNQDASIGGSTNADRWINYKGLLQTTTAGNLSLQWAQDSSSANVTRLRAGSFLSVTRLA